MDPALNAAGVDTWGLNVLVLSIVNILVELADRPSTLVPTKYIPVLVLLIKECDGAAAVPLIARNILVVVWLITYKKLPSLSTKATAPFAKLIGVCRLPDTWNVILYPV